MVYPGVKRKRQRKRVVSSAQSTWPTTTSGRETGRVYRDTVITPVSPPTVIKEDPRYDEVLERVTWLEEVPRVHRDNAQLSADVERLAIRLAEKDKDFQYLREENKSLRRRLDEATSQVTDLSNRLQELVNLLRAGGISLPGVKPFREPSTTRGVSKPTSTSRSGDPSPGSSPAKPNKPKASGWVFKPNH